MNNDSWTDFCHTIENIYQKTKFIDEGKVADYIPQLAKANPNPTPSHARNIGKKGNSLPNQPLWFYAFLTFYNTARGGF